VKAKDGTPNRSYIVATDREEFRRNSFYLTRVYRIEDPEDYWKSESHKLKRLKQMPDLTIVPKVDELRNPSV